MDFQTRVKLFQMAMGQAERQFGVTVQVVAQTRQFGSMIQIEPQLQFISISDWTPKVREGDENASKEGEEQENNSK